MDAPHVYLRAWALGYFYGHIISTPNLSEGADRVGGQLRGDEECPFSGVTKSGKVWRKVPESDAGSVGGILYQMLQSPPEFLCCKSGNGGSLVAVSRNVEEKASRPAVSVSHNK